MGLVTRDWSLTLWRLLPSVEIMMKVMLMTERCCSNGDGMDDVSMDGDNDVLILMLLICYEIDDNTDMDEDEGAGMSMML